MAHPVPARVPCATQNELDGDAARTLLDNGLVAVAEGAAAGTDRILNLKGKSMSHAR